MNDTLAETVNLLGDATGSVTHLIAITNPSLFVAGMNTLRFHVANTGNGHFGSPGVRGGPGDCMYLQFEGIVSTDRRPDADRAGV